MEKYAGDKPIIQVERNHLGTDHLTLKDDDGIWIDTPKGMMHIRLSYKDEIKMTVWPFNRSGERAKLIKRTSTKGVMNLEIKRD